MLWRNRPAIIVGRNQNTAAEINAEFVQRQGIKVIRRITGGGAVYHDLGNLNFSFITQTAKTEMDFRRFAQPIIDVLKNLGVAAEFSGRNDMLIDGRKFSGNAQFISGNRVLHHGTLLFSADLSVVSHALQVRPEKFAGKAVKSISSRVTNISSHLPHNHTLNIDSFADKIIGHIINMYQDAVVSDLTSAEIESAYELVRTKYGLQEWNFGKSPKYNFSSYMHFEKGFIECQLLVRDGMIATGKIYGDFFGNRPADEVAALLIGVKHDYGAIEEALSQIELEQYFAGISKEDVLKVLL